MERLVDLHVHSNASDGDHAPAVVARMAAERGLAACALTDHDTLDGLPAFLDATAGLGVTGVAGVEIGIADDTARGFKEVHVLGYFVEPGDHALGRVVAGLARAKLDWSVHQVQRLVDEGFSLTYDEVRAQADGASTVRRPHIHKVLQRRNPGRLTPEQFFRRTDFGGDLWVPKSYQVSLEDTVAAIRSSGGVAVLAHPAFYGTWPAGALGVLDQAVAAGIQGVEAIYAYDPVGKAGLPSQDEIARVLEAEAKRHGLVVTGGSDYHGSATKTVTLGHVPVPWACYEELAALRRV